MAKTNELIHRCEWVGKDDLMIQYHDEEWGTPLHDDRRLFEFLILEGFQAGLSWRTILHKRAAFRKAFDNFEPEKVAVYAQKKLEQLSNNPDIVRNRLKIAATVTNARCFLNVVGELGSFDKFIWSFTNGKTIQTNRNPTDTPLAFSEISDAMSKELKRRGFKFVGSTICYAFMQAMGMVNDHHVKCFRHKPLSKK